MCAWVVVWTGREERIDKRSGTVVCLLPWRYNPERVRDILDGIYLSYLSSFHDLFWFAKLQTKRRPKIAKISSPEIVTTLEKNPGLDAYLCTDVGVTHRKSIQSITWTLPNNYRRNSRHEIVEEIRGATHRYSFDFAAMKVVRSSLVKR